MPHPTLINTTGLVLEPLALADEEGVPQVVPLIQGTWHIGPNGKLSWLEKQPPVRLAGDWRGDPANTSMRLEPQIAFCKPAGTDVVLLGHAHAPERGATQSQVGLKLGSAQKVARVLGDRHLRRGVGGLSISAPAPFDRIPIVYERAFGGWDRRHEDAAQHRCEWRNPVGVGFLDERLRLDHEQALPNFEDPEHPYGGPGDTPPPAGFGFISPDWQPRQALAGTYDETWTQTRKPLLARDFKRSFFNAASPGLVTQGHLQGQEEAVVLGASPEGRLAFFLPARGAPRCRIETRSRKRVALEPLLDTVIIDLDLRALTLIWRSPWSSANGLHDVRSIELQIARPGQSS